MKVGFSNIYPYRPHGSHANYLAHLVRITGAEVHSLVCPGNINKCYNKLYKGRNSISGLLTCVTCRSGGLTTANMDNISWITKNENIDQDIDRFLVSSSATLHRTESQRSWVENDELRKTRAKLSTNFLNALSSALKWIEKNKFDFVVIFNGRIDMTRAICLACEKTGTPYITHERPWLGDGIHLTPNENCQSLIQRNQLITKYNDVPLNAEQANLASFHMASRFLRTNKLEYALFNLDAVRVTWPQKPSQNEKVLILPGSKSEVAGHAELLTDWDTTIEALDRLLDVTKINGKDIVVRGHPIWANKLGPSYGIQIDASYKAWAQKRGAFYISADSKADTYGLIESSDIVILNGGSSAVEAGACGKKIVSIGRGAYEEAKFLKVLKNYDDIDNFSGFSTWISPDEVIRNTMRYMYTSLRRFPQFTDYVKALTTRRYRFYDGADPDRLFRIVKTGQLDADDTDFATANKWEDIYIDIMRNYSWEGIAKPQSRNYLLSELQIPGNFLYKLAENIQGKLK